MTVFIHKGNPPMSRRQAIKRGLRHFNAEKAYWEREQGLVESDPDYQAWATQWVADNMVNEAHNLFNHSLQNYRKATDRLAQYKVADGRPEITEQQPTGEYDEEGNEIMETVVVQTAVEPLEATVEQLVYSDDPDVEPTLETVPNPLIVADTEERAAAQSVVDATPEDVKDF